LKAKLITIALLFFGSLAQVQAQTLLDKIVARVGGEVLLFSDVEENISLMASRNPNLPPDAACYLMEQLLVQKLLLNQAKLDSLDVSEEEVDAQFNARFEQILGMMNNDPKQFEEYYGQSIPEVRERYREDMKNQMLAERMQQKIIGDVTVTPSEVKRFFAAIPQDSLPYFNSEVEIGEIVIVPKANATSVAEARQKAEEYRQRIVEGGEKFEALASKYSDDKGSARMGGDLGWQKRGALVPEFEAAAYNLDDNGISGVVETEFGFHLIQLLERRGNRIHTRHILIKPEITAGDLEATHNRLDSVRQLVANDSITFEYAVRKFSSDKTQSYNNGGLMLNPKTGNTFFEVGDLDPEVYFTIDTLGVGGISAPVEFSAPQTGETTYKAILLKSRTEPHKANLSEDYSRIKEAALNEKKNSAVEKWVQKTVAKTHIEIDPNTYNCDAVFDKWQVKAQ
jgi:peptidyl-prolyl cis-trans isomerase SurA